MEIDNINMTYIWSNYTEDIIKTFKKLWQIKKKEQSKLTRENFCFNVRMNNYANIPENESWPYKIFRQINHVDFNKAMKEFQFKILNLLLTDSTKYLRRQPSECVKRYLTTQNNKIEETFKKIRNKQIGKLQKLKCNNQNSTTTSKAWWLISRTLPFLNQYSKFWV